MKPTTTEFAKAVSALHKAISLEKNDITRDASIQRFEFCVELAWKTARKLTGTATSSPKQVIRELAQDGLITDVGFWLKAIDMRNLSVHTYNEKLADEVYEFIQTFMGPCQHLLSQLESL